MAGASILRGVLSSNQSSTIFKHFRLFSIFPFRSQSSSPLMIPNKNLSAQSPLPDLSASAFATFRRLCSSTDSGWAMPRRRTRRITATVSPAAAKTNFALDETSESESDSEPKQLIENRGEKNLPPPYDPFSKKPAIEEPEDPKNLQEIFHKMRTEGMMNNAVKMFDALSQDGLTHEALELFGQIKDKGHMPDVVAHTAVIEAYANAGGQSKEALKVFVRMLASGVAPNAYTYTVLIKGLARDGRLADAKKYVMEMMMKGMRPNAGVYTAVFEGFAREEKGEKEGREFLEEMKKMGFVADEKEVREVLKERRGPVVRFVMSILFGK